MKKPTKKVVKAWAVVGENEDFAIASKRDNYITLHYKRVRRPTNLHRVIPRRNPLFALTHRI